MNTPNPKISILIPTYNRADVLHRSLDSILKQTFQDFEIIIVNNGSTDHTKEVLAAYAEDTRVRVFSLEKNRKYTGGFNYALQFIKGEWFTPLGDDDEIVPDGLEQMIRILDEIDPTITAITCNVIETRTNEMSGFGLYENQYLPVEKIISKTSGMFWGITKTELLGDKRLNEAMPGHEHTFWYKIDVIANRYYIHQPLMIWHTEGETTSGAYRKADIENRRMLYRELIKEDLYWSLLKQYNPQLYIEKCLKAVFCLKIANERTLIQSYTDMLYKSDLCTTNCTRLRLIKLSPNWLLRFMFIKYCELKHHWFFRKIIKRK